MLSSLVSGDTFRANTLFGKSYLDVDLVALVDFDNDSVGTSLKSCDALGDRLWGVRLDTSNTLVDKSKAQPAMRRMHLVFRKTRGMPSRVY